MADTTEHIANLIEGLDHGAMVTKFVVIAEVIDLDGDRCVWMDTHEGSSKWDTYGLLQYALTQEQAGQHQAFADDE